MELVTVHPTLKEAIPQPFAEPHSQTLGLSLNDLVVWSDHGLRGNFLTEGKPTRETQI